MKVKELIRELKKCPQDMKVGIAMHDNEEGEVAGWVQGVDVVRERVPMTYLKYKFGDDCVVLHC